MVSERETVSWSLINQLPKITSINSVIWDKLDLVFLSLPNGEAQKIIKKTFNHFKNLRYIDLSADFRIQDPKIYLQTLMSP